MDMSIVMPSFNMLSNLKLSCASVADQEGPSHEQIIVDGASTDGTVDWLASQSHIISIIEPDNGMYDAINKGLDASSGKIVSYLSCYEQYLPGALKFVHTYFERHPDVDCVFGDTQVTRPGGELVCFRKSYRPFWPSMAVSILYVFPAAMFFRRRMFDNHERFDPRFRYGGDLEFVIRMLRKGYRFRNARRYLSTSILTGHNRMETDAARRDDDMIEATLPGWVLGMRRPLNVARLALKLASGAYFERPPLSYAVYVPGAEHRRVTFEARHVSPKWRES